MAKKLFITKKPQNDLATRSIMIPKNKDNLALGERETLVSFDLAKAEDDFTEGLLLSETNDHDYVYCFAESKPDTIHK